MAKKSKKAKQRRHQMKKSKGGQTRKRKPKQVITMPFDRTGDKDSGRLRGISFIKMDDDLPVAEDGFRIVGVAQAMMDYASPLIKEDSTEKEINNALRIAQTCWQLAIFKKEKPGKYKEWIEHPPDIPEGPVMKEVVEMMIERFIAMFPYLYAGREPSPLYIRERVIDIEEYEPFDESTLNISDEKIPPTKKEEKLAETLRMMDPDKDEKKLSKWQDEIIGYYADWCTAKGVPDDVVEHFPFAVNSYLNFLRSYHGENPSNTTFEAVEEFMHTFFIRKTWTGAREKSMMPCALKLFIQYLDEKGIVSDTRRVKEMIESEQDTFQKNLRLYNNPALKE